MEEILINVLSVAIGGLLTYIVTELRGRKRKQDALRAGLQALLRDRIIQSYYNGTMN